MQVWSSVHKLINVKQHINKVKNKNHMIMSVDTEKASDRIQYQFVIKILHKMGIEGTYLNIKRPYMISPELTLYSGVKS